MKAPRRILKILRALALPICAIGLAGSVAVVSFTSHSSEIMLAEGQSASDYFSVRGRVATPEAKRFFGDLKVQTVEAGYLGKLRTNLVSSVSFRGRERTASILRPLWIAPTRVITLTESEYAPRLVVRAPSGRTLWDKTSALELSGPEDEDFVDVPTAKIRVVFTVFPNHAVVDGKDASRSLNPKNPRVRLTVFERVNGVPQQRVLVRKTVAVGENVSIPDGTTIVVRELKQAAGFRALRSPAIPLVPLFAFLTLMAAVDGVSTSRVRQ